MRAESIPSDGPPSEPVGRSSRGIAVSQTLKQNPEPLEAAVHFLVGTPLTGERWQIGHVPTGSFDSKWDLVLSAPGIYYLGESDGGIFRQVAVHGSYIPWLRFHGYLIDFSRDPKKPNDEAVGVYGKIRAVERAETRYLGNAIELIMSRCPLELEALLCEIAHGGRLRAALEWTVLSRDLLECEPEVSKRFAQYLVIIGLNLLDNYGTFSAVELLNKTQRELLQAVRRNPMDLFRSLSGNDQVRAEAQKITLIRALLKFSGGRENCRQPTFNLESTANDNANLYGSFIGITGCNRLGNFDRLELIEALSKSKVFNDDDIRLLNIDNVIDRMTNSLPIGFPKGYLGLPAQVVNRLSWGVVNSIHLYIAQLYRLRPSLGIPGNEALMVLTWSSMVSAHPPAILSEWAASDDGVELYRRLIRDLGHSQPPEQLALALASLMCYKRHLPYTAYETTQSISGSYLEDFDSVMRGMPLINERTVHERMLCSLRRVLDTAGDDYRDTRQFLAKVFDAQVPLLHALDGFSDQYWLYRTETMLSHSEAIEVAGVSKLTDAIRGMKADLDDWIVLDS